VSPALSASVRTNVYGSTIWGERVEGTLNDVCNRASRGSVITTQVHALEIVVVLLAKPQSKRS
jgi:hypothetical protein